MCQQITYTCKHFGELGKLGEFYSVCVKCRLYLCTISIGNLITKMKRLNWNLFIYVIVSWQWTCYARFCTLQLIFMLYSLFFLVFPTYYKHIWETSKTQDCQLGQDLLLYTLQCDFNYFTKCQSIAFFCSDTRIANNVTFCFDNGFVLHKHIWKHLGLHLHTDNQH